MAYLLQNAPKKLSTLIICYNHVNVRCFRARGILEALSRTVGRRLRTMIADRLRRVVVLGHILHLEYDTVRAGWKGMVIL